MVALDVEDIHAVQMKVALGEKSSIFDNLLPLLLFDVYYDEQGNRVGGEMSSKIAGKKAAMVISQGEPYFCSSLVYAVLENNLNDFRLKRVGNIISMSNTDLGDAAAREEDRSKAFELGVALATATIHSKDV